MKPRAALAVLRTGMMHRLAYGAEVLAGCFYISMIMFIFHQLYRRALPAGEMLEGFDQAKVLWYLVLTETILCSSPRVNGLIDEEVRSGHVATFLLRPISYVGYHRWRFMGEAGLNLVPRFLAAGATAWFLVGPPPVAMWAGIGVLVPVFLGLLLHFQVSVTLALSAFWVEDSKPFFWVYQKTLFMLGGLLIPLEFFPDWVRLIAEKLPFALVLHGPARLALDPSTERIVTVVGAQLSWLLLLGCGTEALYRLGTRKVVIHGG